MTNLRFSFTKRTSRLKAFAYRNPGLIDRPALGKSEGSGCDQGFALMGIIVALVIFAVVISGLIVFVNRGPQKEMDNRPKTEKVESKTELKINEQKPLSSRVENEYQAILIVRAEAEEIFLRAKKALEEGDCELALELAGKAFMQTLRTIKETKGTNGMIEESYEQAKKKVMPVVAKIWAFRDRVKEAQENDQCKTVDRSDKYAGDTGSETERVSFSGSDDLSTGPESKQISDKQKKLASLSNTWRSGGGTGEKQQDQSSSVQFDQQPTEQESIEQEPTEEELIKNPPEEETTEDDKDSDGDGIADQNDQCPNDPDNDKDGDGICGDIDNCPNDYNPDQKDSNNNGIGDACDKDSCATADPFLVDLCECLEVYGYSFEALENMSFDEVTKILLGREVQGCLGH